MKRHNRKVRVNGTPQIWTGVNFWSRTGGPLMWRYYDPRIVRGELDALREHGMTLTRSFFYWPDFMPAPDRLDEQLVAHFLDFLDAHQERGMSSIPTFLVGHMSGQNWDPAWRGNSDGMLPRIRSPHSCQRSQQPASSWSCCRRRSRKRASSGANAPSSIAESC